MIFLFTIVKLLRLKKIFPSKLISINFHVQIKTIYKIQKVFFGLILYTPLLCDIIYAKEFCISNECKSFTSDLKFKTSRSYSNNLSYIKFLDNIFDGLLANNLESNNKTSQKELEVNITSDQQETSDDGIFKANGNVELRPQTVFSWLINCNMMRKLEC